VRAYDVLLMADYGCYLWSNSPELQRFREPMEGFAERLGVSPALVAQLQSWHSEWEDMAYSNRGFATPATEREWTDRGWALTQELQQELGTDFDVSYWHAPGGERSARRG
jgi:hypothetical protein